jgi:hypothetical protein
MGIAYLVCARVAFFELGIDKKTLMFAGLA